MKWPIFLWMFIFGLCGVVGYFADIGWMLITGGIGVVYYLFIWRSKVTTLHVPITKWNDLDVINLINEEGTANIDARDMDGNTPLHIAARCNRKNIVQVLIHKGANVNAKNKRGNTPLHWAAVTAALETARILIDAGADPRITNKNGLTPADRAQATGDTVTWHYLLEISVDALKKRNQ